jgi:hypothetical protein
VSAGDQSQAQSIGKRSRLQNAHSGNDDHAEQAAFAPAFDFAVEPRHLREMLIIAVGRCPSLAGLPQFAEPLRTCRLKFDC